jgi:hypothetical protein
MYIARGRYWTYDDHSKTPSQPAARRTLELLQLLASSRHGGSEELLGLGHGCSRQRLAGLGRCGLAAAEGEVTMAGSRTAVTRLVCYFGGGGKERDRGRLAGALRGGLHVATILSLGRSGR